MNVCDMYVLICLEEEKSSIEILQRQSCKTVSLRMEKKGRKTKENKSHFTNAKILHPIL